MSQDWFVSFWLYRNKDEDEGIPSENEEEKKMLDTKARELKGKAVGSGLRPLSVESLQSQRLVLPRAWVPGLPRRHWKMGGE